MQLPRAEPSGALPAAEIPPGHQKRNPQATFNGALRATGADVGRAQRRGYGGTELPL